MIQPFRLALAAFLIPLTIRAIPEIIVGPYPIGYDTIAAYVPAMLDWGSGNPYGFTPLIGGWLVYAILGMTYWTTRVDPVLIIKIFAPMAYGSLGFSSTFSAGGGLGGQATGPFFLSVLALPNFVLLGFRWNYFGTFFVLRC